MPPSSSAQHDLLKDTLIAADVIKSTFRYLKVLWFFVTKCIHSCLFMGFYKTKI